MSHLTDEPSRETSFPATGQTNNGKRGVMRHPSPGKFSEGTRTARRQSGRQAPLWLAPALVLLLGLGSAGGARAEFQWNPFKPGFGKQVAPQAERPPVAPPPASLTAPGKTQPAPAAAKPKPQNPSPTRPVTAPAASQASTPPAVTQPDAPQATAPLPPRRPANLQNGAPATASAPTAAAQPRPGVQAAAVEAAKAAARTGANPVPKSSAEALARVNDWLNSYEAIQARFIQHNAQGQKAEGSLYVRRPGQLVFKYDPPSTLEVVADGKSVAVRDSKLRTNDVYSISQTPLKFLLKDRINLASDTKLLNVATDADGIVRVALSDSSTLGGTSQITLIFDSRANQLKQWNIVDPQGYRTTVALYNIQETPR